MESFWKEYTIVLPKRKEYVFDIRNKKTNCVFIQNYNITNVKVGIKPHAYEIVINPNRSGIINRPFPLNYVYLLANKPTPINIIETITQNPVTKFIRQEVVKNISINTINTIIQNTPLEICQKNVFRPSIEGRLIMPPPIHRTEFIFDLGSYAASNLYLILRSARGSKSSGWRRQHGNRRACYRVYVFNENTGYIRLVQFRFPITLRNPLRYFPPEIHYHSDNVKIHAINEFLAFVSIINNAFRFVSIISSFVAPDFSDRVVIPIR